MRDGGVVCARPLARRQPTRQAGFTLTELMTVVVILGIVSVLAVRMFSKNRRGESVGPFARTLYATVQQARQSAMALRRDARIRLVLPSGGQPAIFYYDLKDVSGTWITQTKFPVPEGLYVCNIGTSTDLGGGGAVFCNAASTAGEIDFSSGTTCGSYFACTFSGTTPTNGATLYVARTDIQDQTSHDDIAAHKVAKIPIYGLTGLPRLIDKW